MESLRHLLKYIDIGVHDARVTLLTSATAAEHPNCQRLAADFSDLVTVRIAPSVTGRSHLFRLLGEFYERQWRAGESLARGLDELGLDTVDFVLLPHLEAIGLMQIGLARNLFRGKPWATIAISVRFHHRRCGIVGPSRMIDRLQEIFFWRILRDPALSCFGTVDPWLARAASHPKVVHCIDPCAPPILSGIEAARAAYGLRRDTCVIVVFGIIDRRKCLDVLLEGAARVIPELDLTVLVAGPQHARHLANVLNGEAARKLRAHGRLVEANRFILSGQDIDPMSAADIAWVFYERNFVASGSVLVRSALARRPVIVRRQGVIGRQVEEFGCGLALASEAPEDVAAALTRLASDPALRQEMGDNGARAFSQNTPENFARPIVDAINRTLTVH
jgi:glycosyltransferase involved in cell wall biosynthesis